MNLTCVIVKTTQRKQLVQGNQLQQVQLLAPYWVLYLQGLVEVDTAKHQQHELVL
jgi:hypothetical protein